MMTKKHTNDGRSWFGRRVSALHQEEGGAVLLAALAGVILLLLVSLTLFDTGNKAREKVKLQTAADTAAYSQAAIKARSMNMNAYANVTKRSVLGVYQTYHSAFSHFFALSQMAGRLQNDPTAPNVFGATRPDATDIFYSTFKDAGMERKRDWAGSSNMGGERSIACCKDDRGLGYLMPASIIKGPGSSFISTRRVAVIGYNLSGGKIQGGIKKYERELQQLTRYQEYIQKMTPWWGFSEASARAVNNGATLASSFPPPDPSLLNMSTLPARFSSIQSSFSGLPSTGMKDWLIQSPSLGREVTLAQSFRRPWSSGEDNDVHQACKPFLLSSEGVFANADMNDEINHNIQILRDRTPHNIAKSFANSIMLANNNAGDTRINTYTPQVLGRLGILSGYSMCAGTMLGLFVNRKVGGSGSSRYANTYFQSPSSYNAAINSYYAAPYHLMVNTGSAATPTDRMALSNIVFAYKEGSEGVKGQERMEFTPQQYDLNGSTHESALGTALWTMARSEIVTHDTTGSTLSRSGEWHSNWTARLRPVAFEGELRAMSGETPSSLASFLHGAFHDAYPLFALSEAMGFSQAVEDVQLQKDMVYMDRAMRALDDKSSAGVFR